MGMKIEWKDGNNVSKTGYLRILNIVVGRGELGGMDRWSSSHAVSNTGEVNADKFNTMINYEVLTEDKSKRLHKGGLKAPYDVDTTSEALAFAYEKLKEDPDMNNLEDI